MLLLSTAWPIMCVARSQKRTPTHRETPNARASHAASPDKTRQNRSEAGPGPRSHANIGRPCWADHGLQSAPFATDHWAQSSGAPELAVVKQSAATTAGAVQLVAQNVSSSSQLVSTGGGSSLTPPPSAGTSGGAAQSPPRTSSSFAAQLALTPPTQACSPQASVRCCPPLSNAHVQSVRDALHAPNTAANATTKSGTAHFARSTAEP